MNQEIKKKWVKALRSGKYQQGRRYLRTAAERFCCLGVLCDVADVPWAAKGELYAIGADFTGTIPDHISSPLGLESHHQSRLIQMNDNGKGFTEIADYIEREL